MRICLVIGLFFPFFTTAQTNISGVINNYYKVIDTIPSKACIRVDNSSGLLANDIIMLVQMKGAAVSTTNNSSFGSVSAMNSAGYYEINTVCSVSGDSVFLNRQLLRSYSVSDKVQLVRIPQYNSAVVTDSLKASPWDSASGKGGVLAVIVWDDMILNAPVSANHAGYKGGSYALSSGTCSNFFPSNAWFYDASSLAPQNGAYKGESVSVLSSAYSGGKGASANGGGGGNNHNNGGGGGANLSAGGAGGGNSSAAGCSATHPGGAAYALTSNSGTRIYAGGGGGAGHANSGGGSSGGGSGGGIVFIHANTIYSNGYKIMSNGRAGGNTLGDGASGGGAGGTMVLDINNYADAVNIEAIGGKGGDEDDDFISQRCYGEGGGGSGGVVYFKTVVPAGSVIVSGGVKGDKPRSLNCGPITAGTAGATGSVVNHYSFMPPSPLSSFCGGWALPVGLVSFNAVGKNDQAMIDWEFSDNKEIKNLVLERKKEDGPWKEIKTISISILRNNYIDAELSNGIYYYRLKIVSNRKTEYSPVRLTRIYQSRRIGLFPNPANAEINIIYPFKKNSEIKIFNSSGQLVFQKRIELPATMIRQNISHLQKGFYKVVIDGVNAGLLVQ